MKYTCSNPTCPRPDPNVDEVEFMQIELLLTPAVCRSFEQSGLCPRCFLAENHGSISLLNAESTAQES